MLLNLPIQNGLTRILDVMALKLIVQVALRYERKRLQKHNCNNGCSAMLSFTTHNHKGMVVASCNVLYKGRICGWLQIGGTRNPCISLVLIGDAQIKKVCINF